MCIVHELVINILRDSLLCDIADKVHRFIDTISLLPLFDIMSILCRNKPYWYIYWKDVKYMYMYNCTVCIGWIQISDCLCALGIECLIIFCFGNIVYMYFHFLSGFFLPLICLQEVFLYLLWFPIIGFRFLKLTENI